MANAKTAISLKKTLFEQVKNLAGEMNISRSQLFALAVEDFIQKHESQKLLQEINQAYDDFPDTTEQKLQSSFRQHHRKIVEEW